ncbi:unnamed protein product [Schistosoma margrebowiei]|uniref:Uncharacterized protein n=1 Tax=Schistosoma margrebowiei TaxID=48269 RepID=A0A183LU92_9TREM|nr:unnamed protein product [Schistosoma margrebowiei]
MKAEKLLINSLKKLKNKGILTHELHDSLKPTGSNTPRLYGLPKVHKTGLPLRPVLDMYNSPYHKTAKFLVRILNPLHKLLVNRSVKDVFDFISKVEHINLNGKRMISLDVASLFTNVPLTETIDFVCQQLQEKQINIGFPGILNNFEENHYTIFQNSKLIIIIIIIMHRIRSSVVSYQSIFIA